MACRQDNTAITNCSDSLTQLSAANISHSLQIERLLRSITLSLSSDRRAVNCQSSKGEGLLQVLCKPLPHLGSHLDYPFSISNVISVFAKQGGDVNTRDSEGRTALYYAVTSLHHTVMQCLLLQGASQEMVTDSGDTALHLACSKALAFPIDNDYVGPYAIHSSRETVTAVLKTIQILVKHGGNINAQNSLGETPLHCAAKTGASNIVEYLLENGSRVNARDANGNTPLHAVNVSRYIGTGHFHTEKLLLSHGAQIHRENNQGRVPFQMFASTVHDSKTVVTSSLILNLISGLDVKRLQDFPVKWIKNIPRQPYTDSCNELSCSVITILYEAGFPMKLLTGCSESVDCVHRHQDGLLDTLQETPLTLKRSAANAVRMRIKPNALIGTMSLRLPKQITDFILLRDINEFQLGFVI